MIELTRNFEAADGRGSNWAREQRKLFAKRREETQRRDQVDERAEADLTAFASGSALATDIQVKALSAKLDRYETATVEALMANDEALDAVRARLEAMLNRAYVISDGRRVFKSEDGTQVFDEFGEEVGPEFVSPHDIDDSFPTWEDYSAELELEQSLKAERTEILEFQARLDEAQEQIENGDVSEADLEELDADLAALMPQSVATRLPEVEPVVVRPARVVETQRTPEFTGLDR